MAPSKFRVGQVGRSAFELPLAVVTETLAVLGRRGSGKTNTAVVIVEGALHAGQQVVVIDPKDEWWGLRTTASGKRSAHAVVVFGGRKADLPLAETDGATVADLVVDERLSCVLALNKLDSKAAVRRFVTDYCTRLYRRKSQADDPTPLLTVLEEAHLFVPQTVSGSDAAMVGAIQQLVRQGRSSGCGVLLIDQRPASVNKDRGEVAGFRRLVFQFSQVRLDALSLHAGVRNENRVVHYARLFQNIKCGLQPLAHFHKHNGSASF